MKRIDIYINEKNDLIEKYSANEVSNELINYMIQKVMMLRKSEDFNINLYVNEDTKGCAELIKEGLKIEYTRSIKIQNNNNIKQIVLFIIGVILMFVSTFVSHLEIIQEIIIIIGWVPIWEAVEFELFNDSNEKNKRKCINKLLNKQFNEIESDDRI